MTIILGLKKDDEVWLAADSQVVADNFIVDTAKSSKIIKLPNCSIGFAGNVMFREYFELFYFHRSEDFATLIPPNPTRLDIMGTFITFWTFVKEHEARMFGDESETYTALVATPTSLFEVDPDNTVTEISRFSGIGSGGVMAYGVMECLWGRSVAPEDILKETHRIVCSYNNMCGGEQEIINLSRKITSPLPVQMHKKPTKKS